MFSPFAYRSSRPLVALVLGCLITACGGSAEAPGQALSADLSAKNAAHADALRGHLAKGALTPIAIVEKQGEEDTNQVDVDFSRSKVANAETALKSAFKGKEFWIRGDITERPTGKSVGGSMVLRDVLVAQEVATVTKDDATSEGALERRSDGTFQLVVKAGEGTDSDDAGSFELDVTSVADPSALVGKHVHVVGMLVKELVGVVHGSFVSRDLILVGQIAE